MICMNLTMIIGRNPLARSAPPLKSSSSLDSSFGIGLFGEPNSSCGGGVGAISSQSIPPRPQSPYSSNSDITHFLASTYGRHHLLKSPTNTDIAKVTNKQFKSASEHNASKYEHPHHHGSKIMTSANFANEIKNIQQKILEELKTGELANSSNFMNNKRSNQTKLNTLTGIGTDYQSYRSLLDNSLLDNSPTAGYNRNYQSRNSYNLRNTLNMTNRYNRNHYPGVGVKNNIFKSYEYESLNPVRYGEDKYRLTRPMSSILFYENSASTNAARDTLLHGNQQRSFQDLSPLRYSHLVRFRFEF